MAKYTIDVYTLLKDNNFKVFNFDYDFYTDDPNIKQAFETKFIDRYMFNEIGFETVARFKHYLKERLNSIAPYYKQLYETELKSKDIQFLLNKDLKETFIREIEGNNISSTNSKISTNNNSTSNSSQDNTNKFKESNLDNGNADLGLSNGNLTNVNETTDNTSINNTTSTIDKSDINNNSNTSNNETETTTLISQGNIGVTSSAELLRDWRSVLINIDNLIIEECKDLFMSIY